MSANADQEGEGVTYISAWQKALCVKGFTLMSSRSGDAREIQFGPPGPVTTNKMQSQLLQYMICHLFSTFYLTKKAFAYFLYFLYGVSPELIKFRWPSRQVASKMNTA